MATGVTHEADAGNQAPINVGIDKQVNIRLWLVDNTHVLNPNAEDLKEVKASDIAHNVDYLAG